MMKRIAQMTNYNISVTSQTKEKFLSIIGEMQVPIRFLRKPLPYKYIVYTNNGKNQKIHWEYSEFCNDYYPRTFVPRDLVLLEKYRTKNGNYKTLKRMHLGFLIGILISLYVRACKYHLLK